MPEQPTPPPVAAPAEEVQRQDPLAAAVAEAVTKLRRTAGLSERAAAKRLGTSQTQLRRMEDPRYLPSLRSLARVATAYGAQLKVSFEAQNDKDKPAPQKAAPAKPAAAKPARRPARGAAPPSKGRRASPGRARAGVRRKPRRAAPRRRGR